MMHLKMGVALVTSRGVLFRCQYYSCSVAIKEGWFSKESTMQFHILRVIYYEVCDFIWIVHEGKILVADRLPRNQVYDKQALDHYYIMLNELKGSILIRRRKRHRTNKINKQFPLW